MTSIGDPVTLEDGANRVVLYPTRGAIVTSFRVGERELLYLDEATLLEPARNVRGGIPVLFPSPGKLEGDRFRRGDASGALPQHGFARTNAWRVVEPDGGLAGSHVTVELASDPGTLAAFPYAFRFRLAFSLRGSTLRIESTVENAGGRVLPFALGYHPYFLVRDKARARVPTDATRAWDNVEKRERDFSGFELATGEVDIRLLDHRRPSAELELEGEGRIGLRASPEFRDWVVWTLPGKDFVCVEPWTAPGNALNTGVRVTELAPGARATAWVEIEWLEGSAARRVLTSP